MKITCMPSGPLGVNTYLVVDEETKEGFIVDPGGYNPKLTKKVSDEGIEIKYIVLTHGHADHISGVNEHLDDFPDAKVVVHTNEKPMLEDPRANQSLMFGSAQTVNGDIFVNDGDELEVGNLKLKFIFTPGHTPGGMCIYVESEDVLFSGDTLFRHLADAVHTKLFILPDETVVLPGHMGQTSIGFEKGNNPFV